MNGKSLKVTMLGNFSMEYDGQTIRFERNSATKANQLLQILLCYRNGIAKELLIQKLFGEEEIADTSNSLRAVVFRLRRLFEQSGFLDEKAIRIQRGVYVFSPEAEVDCDIYRFEELVSEAFAKTAERECYELLRQCCESYKGPFLPMHGSCEWTIAWNLKYKNMYFDCVRKVCGISRKYGDYETMLAVSERAAALYPFDEWQSCQMEALVALGKVREASKLYEETGRLMFEELGVALPVHMTEQMRELGRQVQNRTDTMGEVIKNLQEAGEIQGAFFCAYPHFVESYRLVKRVIERTGQSAWLLLCTITDGRGYALEGGERVEVLAQEVEQAIRQALRRGDMYTKYSASQYLALMMELKQEDCRIVVERINACMERKSRKNYLSYHIAPLNSVLGEAAGMYDVRKNAWSDLPLSETGGSMEVKRDGDSQ